MERKKKEIEGVDCRKSLLQDAWDAEWKNNTKSEVSERLTSQRNKGKLTVICQVICKDLSVLKTEESNWKTKICFPVVLVTLLHLAEPLNQHNAFSQLC